MKLKILKKTVKEGTSASGVEYCIKSLFVGFSEADVYNAIVEHLQKRGASSDSIEKFCKPNEYKGVISYAFWLNCSHFTWDTVERFGILDAKVIFAINDSGFVNAKIMVENRLEQITKYEAPEEQVTGWSCGNPETVKSESQTVAKLPNVESYEVPNLADLGSLEAGTDDVLPF